MNVLLILLACFPIILLLNYFLHILFDKLCKKFNIENNIDSFI